MNQIHQKLEDVFHLSERDSDVGQELRASLATFLTMSYILLVNPQLLSELGLSPTMVVVSTAISSAIGSALGGYLGNIPLGLAPGIGLSAYLTYGLVMGEGLSVKEAFTTCFISGLILLFFSLTGVSQFIMRFIPRSVKLATIVGMGMQIALVGMTSIHLVVPNNQTIVGLGDVTSYRIWIAFLGLILIGSLLYHDIAGGILIGIFIVTFITWFIEDSFPTSYVQFPDLMINPTQFISFSDYDIVKCLPGIAAFLFIGIIDVSGVIFGMASLAGLAEETTGNVPGAKGTFIAVSISTLVSAATGGTPVIVYVESATGIKEGGKTGLTGVFIGVLFLLSIFFAPALGQIPVTATSPVAILIGAMMMSQAKEIDWENMSEAIPGFLTAVVMPFTFSITNGIIFGLIASFCFYITTGQIFKDIIAYFNPTNDDAVNEMTPLSGNNTLSPHKQLERKDSLSFMDEKPFGRMPSLIISKEETKALHDHNNHMDGETHHSHHSSSENQYKSLPVVNNGNYSIV